MGNVTDETGAPNFIPVVENTNVQTSPTTKDGASTLLSQAAAAARTGEDFYGQPTVILHSPLNQP